jgi:flavodoxin I
VKAVIVYDSAHGNTARIAQAIGQAIGGQVLQVGEVNPADLEWNGLLIVGSPTHGGWFTEGMRDLLEALPALEGAHVAAFDTRTASIWNRILPFGYAAPRIAQRLEEKGGTLLAPPEGFVVLGTRGPLQEGELERAADWAKGIAGAATAWTVAQRT